MRDNSTVEILPKAENKVEEKLFTIDDKYVTNERNSRQCKRSNIEKIKLNGIGISEYGVEKAVLLKLMFSTLNLNFSNVMSRLLEEEQRSSCKISTTPPERSADTSVSSNSSQSVCLEINKDILDSQDQELLSILEELQISDCNLPFERSVNINVI